MTDPRAALAAITARADEANAPITIHNVESANLARALLARDDVPRLVAALTAVLDYHRTRPDPMWQGDGLAPDYCHECGGSCHITKAITAALTAEQPR